MRLAVVEEDRALCARVAGAIRSAGHNCYEFHSGDAMRRSLRRESYDLLIVDEHLPDMPSDELINWMTSSLSRPPSVILLTDKNCAQMHATADDCVPIPAAEGQISEHVDAVLRKRFAHVDASGNERFGDFVFDSKARTVVRNGVNIPVTAKEFGLAQLFFRNLDRPLSRAHVMDAIWGRRLEQGSRTLDAHVSQIRSRLALTAENGLNLGAIYGFGYRLAKI